jgi:hypothetical protein
MFFFVISLLTAMSIVHSSAPLHAAAQQAAMIGELDGAKLGFAYVDGSGKQLLGSDSENPERFVQAVYAQDKTFAVQYVRHQSLSDQSNGRQTEWNFDQDGGELYKVVQGTIEHNSSVLLAEKDALKEQQFLKYRAVVKSKFAANIVYAIEKAKKRKVLHTGLLGYVPGEAQIGIVEFARVAGT